MDALKYKSIDRIRAEVEIFRERGRFSIYLRVSFFNDQSE